MKYKRNWKSHTRLVIVFILILLLYFGAFEMFLITDVFAVLSNCTRHDIDMKG